MGQEPRQTTSNIGHLQKPSLTAMIHGLNRHYYSINISYRKNELEQKMLLNLHKKTWACGLKSKNAQDHAKKNQEMMESLLKLAKDYSKRVEDSIGKTVEEL